MCLTVFQKSEQVGALAKGIETPLLASLLRNLYIPICISNVLENSFVSNKLSLVFVFAITLHFELPVQDGGMQPSSANLERTREGQSWLVFGLEITRKSGGKVLEESHNKILSKKTTWIHPV